MKMRERKETRKMKMTCWKNVAWTALLVGLLGTGASADEITRAIVPTKVQQRLPWNGLVDIVVTNAVVNGTLVLSATDAATGESLAVTSLTRKDDGTAFQNGVTTVTDENLHLVWDASKDIMKGTYAPNARLNVQVKYTSSHAAYKGEKYMVIDVSGGANAASHAISYLEDVPDDGWTDTYKTTKIVLRHVEAGTFTMGSPSTEEGVGGSDETQHRVTLTQPFWIGVFETTQKQYELLTGSNPSQQVGDTYPVDYVSYDMLRGESSPWPADTSVAASSVMGRLRAKTGHAFDLPTEAQWEYACRAGMTSAFNNGTESIDGLGLYYYNGGHKGSFALVGSYLPNAWGLYDMHGNKWEWCCDRYFQGTQGNAAETDPLGAATGSYRVVRGGSFKRDKDYCRSAVRWRAEPAKTYDGNASGDGLGFRLACSAAFEQQDAPTTFVLDLREGALPVYGYDAVAIPWDASWASNDPNATVVLTVNGTDVVADETGAGEYLWEERTLGTYAFQLSVYEDGVIAKRFKATLERRLKDFAPEDVQVTDYEGFYDGNVHTITVTQPSSAERVFTLTPDESRSWRADPPKLTEPGTLTVWVRVQQNGYNSYITNGVVTIYPVVTSQGVPFKWLEEQGLILASKVPDDCTAAIAAYERAAGRDVDDDGYAAWQEYLMRTDPLDENDGGNDDADGDGLTRWEEYVVGTDPNDGSLAGRFTARLEIVDGQPKISWSPDLGDARAYEVVGKARLEEGEWQPADMSRHRFFKVRVRLEE